MTTFARMSVLAAALTLSAAVPVAWPGSALAQPGLQNLLQNVLQGQPTPLTVNCAAGQTIGGALATTIGPVTITVVGTCVENVTITKDDVTLQGDPGASISPADSTLATVTIGGVPAGPVVTGNAGRGLQCFGGEAKYSGNVSGFTANALGGNFNPATNSIDNPNCSRF